MMKFNREEGLTLIELLITISVLAIVSAIALPVINNVVTSSNSNALVQMNQTADDFITKYNAAGTTIYANGALQGFVDTDGDNTIDATEVVDTFKVSSKHFLSVGASSAGVGGSYDYDAVSPEAVSVQNSGY